MHSPGPDEHPRSDPGGATVSLYQAQEKIFPREVDGRFQNLRTLTVYILLGVYYILPWVRWGDRPAILFDLPARKFHILGLTLWPQDLILLALLLIVAAVSLFFFTAIAGRLWCGFACPQTVWTETFIWLERLTEGDRRRQMKLDAGPWSKEKIARRSAKHLLWLSLSTWTGFTFVGYFTPITELAGATVALTLGPWETFWVVFYSLATYGNAGFLREQVCIYMCPYARFQSAMFDRDTLIVSYDRTRGEPRGGRARDVDPSTIGKGDCIECSLCVQVCPTGIDIREGLQYQCIACAACVDVCDGVMDRMGYDRGLIRYTTESELDGRDRQVLRPRIYAYMAVLVVLAGALTYGIAQRADLIVDVIRDRKALYQVVGQEVENVYTIKLANKSDVDRRLSLAVRGLDGARIVTGDTTITVSAGAVRAVPLRVRVPFDSIDASNSDIYFEVNSDDGMHTEVTTLSRFLAPIDGAS